MSLTSRKIGIIYGPVNSRRLGRSLGINLMGNEEKICSLNCKYCERGWTEFYDTSCIDNKNFPDVPEVAEALAEALDSIHTEPEYFTFSGNGEPTLHPDFPEIVDEVIRNRNEKSPKTKIAILSNSTTLGNPKIIEALEKLDEKIMKLDAGNEETFKLFNDPLSKITLDEVVEGIKQLKNITVQALFANGIEGNYTIRNLIDWIEKLKIINPDYVQIYTLDRGYPSENIYPLEIKELHYIEFFLRIHKIKAKIYY
jgi:wyosine [tRNA(Phe)-imidazoG37] synthetase (radical SAM superfamily)